MRKMLTLAFILFIATSTFAQSPRTYLIDGQKAVDALANNNVTVSDLREFQDGADTRGQVAIRLVEVTPTDALTAIFLSLGAVGDPDPNPDCAAGIFPGEQCSGDARGVKIKPHPVTRK